jgi:hypothetical protein
MVKLTHKALFIIFLILFTSCLGTKKVTDKEAVTTKTEKTTTKTDSTSKVDTNLGINDRIVVNVPQANDENTTKLVDAILSQLNTSKSSGGNSYTSSYDKETRKLVIDFIIASTQNKETRSAVKTDTEQTFEQTVTENTKKVVKMIPWWLWLIVGVWFLPQIINRVKLILVPFSGISFKKDI